MIRARVGIALIGVLMPSVSFMGCHRTAQQNAGVAPVAGDTVAARFGDTAIAAISDETRIMSGWTPAQRDSLLALVKKERVLWDATKPRDYEFLLRVSCFCPGQRGWLLMEVRSAQPLKAWDAAGKPVALTDWNTFSIDGLFDTLERAVGANRDVRVIFDARWHFPALIYAVTRPGPDMWATYDARGFRPL
jgi:hypothetical protein